MTLYAIVKWLHVLLAIAAVGTNLTYGVWLTRAGRDPAALPFTLRGVKILDDRIANPAYGLLLLSGVMLLALGPWMPPPTWLVAALVIFVVVVVIGTVGYTPTLRSQIRLAESSGPASPEYQRLATRGQRLGILLAVLVVAISFLMVVKPPF